MANGDGSIIPRGRGVWEVQVSLGKDPITGKYRKTSRTVHGTKAEARKVRDQIKRELEGGVRLDAGKVTLSDFVETWAEARRTSGRACNDTIAGDVRDLRHVTQHLGNVPISGIDAQMIESTYAAIRASGRISGTSLRRIHTQLKSVFKKAVSYDLIARNPCDKVEAPKEDSPQRHSLNAEEASRLLQCLNESEAEEYCALADKEQRQVEWGTAFGRSSIKGVSKLSCIQCVRIALATGMRQGEVLGLTWGDVDLKAGRIVVSKAVGHDGALKAPKTRAGVRTISIDHDTLSHLAVWRTRQAVELAKIGVYQSDEMPVCCSNVGGRLNAQNFGKWWRGWRNENGYPTLKYHELRHTQATQLLANGVDVKTVQTRLGHADASLTLDCYAHAIPKNDEKAAQLVGELFKAKPPAPRIIEVKTA